MSVFVAPLDMSEHIITYSDLKFGPSKRQKHEDKVRQKEMSTYSELKFQNQAEQQRGRRFQEAGSRGAGGSPNPSRRNKGPPCRRQCATVILGILCLVLLIATGVLSYLVTKLSQGKGINSELLTSCSGQQPGLPEIPDEQPGDTGQKCPARWATAEGSSYLFSPQKGTWEYCKSSCKSQSAQQLSIGNRNELDFIKQELYQYYEDRKGVLWYYPFWIGLSYDPGSRKWVWEDNTALSSGLFDLQDLSHQNDLGRVCAYIQAQRSPSTAPELCRKSKAPLSMSNYMVTYPDLKLDPSKRQKHEGKVSPRASSSWLPLALALGAQMLCLLLMIGLRIYDGQVSELGRELGREKGKNTQLLTSCQGQKPGFSGTEPRGTAP
ncbi:hypothetical protein Y1Q_0010541 [Alligator mississippiensis]|uniref:C-type lectin domain-containing protein n=1 Tax=Alligator mississippiensis TaxID=8496 RepID=A0A151NDC4_ALLMI|nr:hypothetical protein Y1Q_0010541 [Alligator mississippiensis]